MSADIITKDEYIAIIKALHANGGNKAAAARALNLTRNTFEYRLNRARILGFDLEGYEPRTNLPGEDRVLNFTIDQDAPGEVEEPQVPAFDFVALRRCLKNGHHDLDSLAVQTKATRGQVLDGIDSMRKQGYSIAEINGKFWLDTSPQTAADLDKKHEYLSRPDGTYIFGFTSDNHLGSKYSRLDVLHKLYARFEEVQVDRVFNAGNWIDGEASFNKHDLIVHGLDAQCRYLAQNWPKVGITTYAVTGDDHEGWYSQREGIDVGRYAEESFKNVGRNDWVDLGYMECDIALVSAVSGVRTRLRVAHPGGGSAYATSYAPQKYIESLDGGEKPAVVLLGHWHKMEFLNIRNVWSIQTGCFMGGTQILTDQGYKSIKNVQVGDKVLTHKNRYKRVTKTMVRDHEGDFIHMRFGRKGPAQSIRATPEHPVLVERNGKKCWVEIGNIEEGEIVFVPGTDCPITGERIPYYMALSKHANPMDAEDVRNKLSATRGGHGAKRKIEADPKRKQSDGEKHMENDIIPFCHKMEMRGWRMIPTGARPIPDAIGIKDGQVWAFELESKQYISLDRKKLKYEGSAIEAAVDGVKWVNTRPRKEQPRSWYEADAETGMVKVKVMSIERHPIRGAHNRTRVKVYNFSVKDDESYVAGNLVVHNCTQDQTPFARKKKLDFQVGGGIVKLVQDPETGAIVSCTVEFLRYFNKAHYGTGRWSHHAGVTMAERSPG